MSMVMMTQDLPRSPDGLPMEWLEVPFGPLFPGLPGGLALTFTLDGDTVTRASLTQSAVARGLAATWSGPVSGFPTRFARLDPLAGDAYRVLAVRALEAMRATTVDRTLAWSCIGVMERQRALSHLTWLASFAWLLGDRWLRARAISLLQRLRGAPDVDSVARLRPGVDRFVDRVRSMPPLRWRLQGVGGFEGADTARLRGPVARAAGGDEDARTGDPLYHDLGFTPVLRHCADAWSCLEVRLAEMRQSLDLMVAAGALSAPDLDTSMVRDGTGMATVETPRGRSTLHLTVSGGLVQTVDLDAPSTYNMELLQTVTFQQEVSDALVGVVSLDLSPWELDR